MNVRPRPHGPPSPTLSCILPIGQPSRQPKVSDISCVCCMLGWIQGEKFSPQLCATPATPPPSFSYSACFLPSKPLLTTVLMWIPEDFPFWWENLRAGLQPVPMTVARILLPPCSGRA